MGHAGRGSAACSVGSTEVLVGLRAHVEHEFTTGSDVAEVDMTCVEDK